MPDEIKKWHELVGGMTHLPEPGMLIPGGVTRLCKCRIAGESRSAPVIRPVCFDRKYITYRIARLLFRTLQQPNLDFYLDLVTEAWDEYNEKR